MKKLNILFAIVGFSLSLSLCAQKRMSLPPADELRAINDSIVSEGVELYLMEKVSWMATDFFVEKCEDKSRSEGYVTWFCGEDSVSTIFYNRSEKKCIFEVLYRLSNNGISVFQKERDLDSLELERIDRRTKAFRQMKVTSIEDGSVNKSYLAMSDDKARVYCLQGISKHNVIPFGNDAYADFDYDGNMLNFVKCHNSYIPIELPVNKLTVGTIIHTHLDDNPYITPSDIATFMMYGRDLYKLNTFYVYSTAFGVYFKFDSNADTITLADPEKDIKNLSESFDYDKTKSYVQNNRKKYDELLTRFQNADSTLTDKEISNVYYGFAFTEAYSGFETDDDATINKLIGEEKLEEAKQKLDSALIENPVNTKLLITGFALYSSLEDYEMLDKIRWKIDKLIDTILRSGSGTKERPISVISVADEYVVMYQALGVSKVKQQSLVDTCDVMDVNISEDETQIYFDTRCSLMKMKEMFK